MGTPAQVGKREYKATLREARQANEDARQVLRRIVREVGSGLVGSLVGQVSLAIGKNDDALNRLEEIGETIRKTD
jgi:hypothetical protein